MYLYCTCASCQRGRVCPYRRRQRACPGTRAPLHLHLLVRRCRPPRKGMLGVDRGQPPPAAPASSSRQDGCARAGEAKAGRRCTEKERSPRGRIRTMLTGDFNVPVRTSSTVERALRCAARKSAYLPFALDFYYSECTMYGRCPTPSDATRNACDTVIPQGVQRHARRRDCLSFKRRTTIIITACSTMHQTTSSCAGRQGADGSYVQLYSRP